MRVYLASILLITFSFAQAQSIQSDTAFLNLAIKNSISLYAQSFRAQSGLYNGTDYVEPKRTGEPHAFFLLDDWMPGNVIYNGTMYENIPLLYDLMSDKLVTELHFNGTPIALVNEKVSRFSLASHTFERIVKETVNNSLPQTGFYDILYNGKTRLIVKRQKNLQEALEGRELKINYEEKAHYFILKNGVYFPVRSKSSLLKVLDDQMKELKQYSSKNRIRFKSDRGAALARMARFYDTLKPVSQ